MQGGDCVHLFWESITKALYKSQQDVLFINDPKDFKKGNILNKNAISITDARTRAFFTETLLAKLVTFCSYEIVKR